VGGGARCRGGCQTRSEHKCEEINAVAPLALAAIMVEDGGGWTVKRTVGLRNFSVREPRRAVGHLEYDARHLRALVPAAPYREGEEEDEKDNRADDNGWVWSASTFRPGSRWQMKSCAPKAHRKLRLQRKADRRARRGEETSQFLSSRAILPGVRNER